MAEKKNSPKARIDASLHKLSEMPAGKEKDVYMMAHPNLWPRMTLPLVRRREFDRPSIGFLVGVQGVEHVVFLDNLFTAGGDRIHQSIKAVLEDREPEISIEKFNSYEEILDSGWTVD